jgi:hypothetical protein
VGGTGTLWRTIGGTGSLTPNFGTNGDEGSHYSLIWGNNNHIDWTISLDYNVLGGANNIVDYCKFGTILNGKGHRLGDYNGYYSSIIGGKNNVLTGNYSAIIGGTSVTSSVSNAAIAQNFAVAQTPSGAFSAGVATLSTGGAVTVNTTKVNGSCVILLTSDVSTTGFVRVSARVSNTSFTIQSSVSSDRGNVSWLIIQIT